MYSISIFVWMGVSARKLCAVSASLPGTCSYIDIVPYSYLVDFRILLPVTFLPVGYNYSNDAKECLAFAASVVITYSSKRTKAMMLQRSILSSLGRSRQPFRSIITTNVAMIQNQPKSSSIPTHDSRQHDYNQRQYHPSSLCRSISSTTSPLQVPADTDFVVVQQNTGSKCK